MIIWCDCGCLCIHLESSNRSIAQKHIPWTVASCSSVALIAIHLQLMRRIFNDNPTELSGSHPNEAKLKSSDIWKSKSISLKYCGPSARPYWFQSAIPRGVTDTPQLLR